MQEKLFFLIGMAIEFPLRSNTRKGVISLCIKDTGVMYYPSKKTKAGFVE